MSYNKSEPGKFIAAGGGYATVAILLLRMARERFVTLRYPGVVAAIDTAIVGANARLAQLKRELENGK